MKSNIVLFVLIAGLAGGTVWVVRSQPQSPPAINADGSQPERKILYYQSPMHPWIKSDKPGKCPICGMNLVPIYAETESTNTGFGLKLNADSVNVVNVQTATIERRQIVHSLRVAGAIEMGNHPAYFVFNGYERDFVWLNPGETVEVTFPSMPGKIYHAKITRYDTRYLDPNRNDLTHGIEVSATLSDLPARVDGLNRWRPFDGFYAEGRVIVEMPEVLAIPRSAVLSAGPQPTVYVDAGGGRYEPRNVTLGRIGDEYAEVLEGLKEGEKVVTTGNLLIDAEAQITRDTDN